MNHEADRGREPVSAREAESVDNKLLDLLSDKKLPEWGILADSLESFEDTTYQVKGFKTSVTLGESVYEVRLEKREGAIPEQFKDSPFRIRIGRAVEEQMVFVDYNFLSQTPEHELAQQLYFNLEDDLMVSQGERMLEAQNEIRAEFESALLDLRK